MESLMHLPDIEIVIPTYNRLSYLRIALASALNQRSENFRVTIVDSGSTDGTDDFLEGLASDKLRIVRFKDNLGVAANWTRAFAVAEASLVSFFHDDDIMHPDFVSHQIQMFRANPDMVLCHTAAEVVNADGDILFLRSANWPPVTGGEEFTKRVLTEDGLVPVPPSVVINQALLPSAPAFSSKYLALLDLVEWIKVSRHGKVGYIKEPLVQYRLHGSQTQNIVLSRYSEKLNQRERFFDFMRNELVDRNEFTLTLANHAAWRYFSRALTSDLMNISALGASILFKVEFVSICGGQHPKLWLSPRFLGIALFAVLVPAKVIEWAKKSVKVIRQKA